MGLWLQDRGLAKGAIVDVQTVFALGHRWYSGRFDAEWERPDSDDVVSMFASLGLVGSFWEL